MIIPTTTNRGRPDGDLAAVGPGQPVPIWIPACSWAIVPPPGCQAVANIAHLAQQTVPYTYEVTVATALDAAPLIRVVDGRLLSGSGFAVSPPGEPLVVNFTNLGQGVALFDFQEGFRASFWTRCDPDRDVLTDITLERVLFVNNAAPRGSGGGVVIVPGDRYADPRVVAVAVVDSRFESCSALSGGGMHGARRAAAPGE